MSETTTVCKCGHVEEAHEVDGCNHCYCGNFRAVRGGPPAPDAPTPTDAECAAAKYAEACELLQAVFHREPCCDLLPYGHSVVDEGIPALEAEIVRLRALLAAGTPQPTDGLAAFFPPSPKARVSEPGPIRTEAADVVATVRATARSLGYAVALHGSMRRDLDLIAAPWTDEAVPPEELAEAVRVAVGGYWRAAHPDPYVEIGGSEPAKRSHGRLAWSIYGVLGTYIDLSVMPPLRAVVPPPPDTAAAPTRDEQDDAEFLRATAHDMEAPWIGRWANAFPVAARLRAIADRLRAPAPATDDAPTDAWVPEGVLVETIATALGNVYGNWDEMGRSERQLKRHAARAVIVALAQLPVGRSGPRATAPAPTKEEPE
jgi:hypothetical protein